MGSILQPGYLRWDGFKYVLDPTVEIVGPPGPPGPAGTISGTTAGGDLSGTYPNPTVTGIRGNSVPSPSGSSTVLQWSGTALSWATVSGSGSGNGFAPFQVSSGVSLILTRAATQSWLYQYNQSGGAIHFPTAPDDGDVVMLDIQATASPEVPSLVTLNGGSNFVQSPYSGNFFYGSETPSVYSVVGIGTGAGHEGLLLVYQWSATFDAWLCISQSGMLGLNITYSELSTTWTIPPYVTLMINTSTGSPVSTIKVPSSIVSPGITVTVADPGATWGTHNVTISYGSASNSIENPGALGTYSSSVTLNTNGMSVTWQQTQSGTWKVISLVT